MAIDFDAPFGGKLTFLGAIGAVILTVYAVWYWQAGVVPDNAPSVPAPVWDGPIGPGLATRPSSDLPPLGADLPALHEPGLRIDEGGHLVPDLALRALMDSFLARGPSRDRLARVPALRARLRTSLAAPAAAEANRIVSTYLDYLEARDGMLAREHFSASADAALTENDVAQLLAWQDQQTQLRQRMLGTALAQAWFDGDNARCIVVLRDWQKQHLQPDPAQEPDPVEQHERRMHGEVLAARRDADARDCATQMHLGFTVQN